MKLLYCGDIVGRPGRAAVARHLPGLRRTLGLDLVVGNGENAAAGFGITPKVAAELHDAGIDIITTGNHAFDQREIIPYLDRDQRILRPANYPPGTPGRGATLIRTEGGFPPEFLDHEPGDSLEDPGLGWTELVQGRLEIRTMPGDHLSILDGDGLPLMARLVGQLVGAATGR